MTKQFITKAFCLAAVAFSMAIPSQALAKKGDVHVTGVAPNDTLNVRAGPGTGFPVIDRLAPNAGGLRKVTCTPFSRSDRSYGTALKQQLQALPTWCLIKQSGDKLSTGWVNARFLAPGAGGGNSGGSGWVIGNGGGSGSGSGQGGQTHAQLCNTKPTLAVDLSQRGNWRLGGQVPAAVTQNRSPGWDAGAQWMSRWPDGGRQVAGPETRLDFTIDFCSCGAQNATYQVTGLRVDDRAELFLDGVNWSDLGPSFRADMAPGAHGKTHSAAGQRQFMIRVHNDRTTQDNPTGLALQGMLFAQNSYAGPCRN